MAAIVLTREEVISLIDMPSIIEAVKDVYKLKADDKTVVWPLVEHQFTDRGAVTDIRSGYISGVELHGAKVLNNFPGNTEKGLAPFNGTLMVFDSNTGLLLGVLDASYITSMRTGAAGALGAATLARPDSKTLMILGAGKQAIFQIAASLILMPNLNRVVVAARSEASAQGFVDTLASRLESEFGIITENKVELIAAPSVEAATRMADIIITITPARTPAIARQWVKPGTHLSCVGADMVGKQEVESALVAAAKIYTDDTPQCLNVGELELPYAEGLIQKKNVTGEIGHVLTGQIEGRTSDEEITLFDATGLALLDLASAKIAITKAQETGKGTQILL